MKHPPRILSLLLAMTVMLTVMVLPTAAADATPDCSLEIDRQSVTAGDTVTVTIKNTDMTLAIFGCYLEFDTEALRCTQIIGAREDDRLGLYRQTTGDPRWTPCNLSGTVEESNTNGVFYFSCLFAQNHTFLAGTVATLTFEALCAGEVSISLSENSSMVEGDAYKGLADTVNISVAPTQTVTPPVDTPPADTPSVDTPPIVTPPSEDIPPVTPPSADKVPQPQEPAMPFTDVSKEDPYYDAIVFVYQNDLFKGTSDTEFSPDVTMTRSMFVTVLGRLDGINPAEYQGSSFADVVENEWYAPYVEWAASEELVLGYGTGLFGITDPITVEQAIVILERYASKTGIDTVIDADLTGYTDADMLSDWAEPQMKWAVSSGIYTGSAQNLSPKEPASRALLAQILHTYTETFVTK